MSQNQKESSHQNTGWDQKMRRITKISSLIWVLEPRPQSYVKFVVPLENSVKCPRSWETLVYYQGRCSKIDKEWHSGPNYPPATIKWTCSRPCAERSCSNLQHCPTFGTRINQEDKQLVQIQEVASLLRSALTSTMIALASVWQNLKWLKMNLR